MKEQLKQGLSELFDGVEVNHKERFDDEVKLFFLDKKLGFPFFTLELQNCDTRFGELNKVSCEIDVSVREVYTKLLGLTGNKKYYLKEKQLIYLWDVFVEFFNETFGEKLGFNLPNDTNDFSETHRESEIPNWVKGRITPYKENVDFSESNEISFQKIRKIYNPNVKVVTTF